mgnify:CR=1 FL=1
MAPIVNIAAYKFAALANLEEMRRELQGLSEQLQLRGSILLSVEGINLFVAGSREGIDTLLDRIRQIPGVGDIDVKESLSQERPFNRMLVKIKKEIIAFDVPGIDPREYSSRRVSARQLKSWLDEGRSITLLDTRNNFEIKVGTFQNARAIDLEDFRDFPKAVDRLPSNLKRETIVTFCTGGIRCEKAAPYLEREGFRDVYQLDGGILKYFEECGSEHFQGQCFVFDKRVAVDANLQECSVRQCFACWAVLSTDDLASPDSTDVGSRRPDTRPPFETDWGTNPWGVDPSPSAAARGEPNKDWQDAAPPSNPDSNDALNWNTAIPFVKGNGSRLQWIDNGPPKTTSSPGSQLNRFYRAILVP